MADCYALQEKCQRVGERYDYAFNWTLELSRKRQPNTPYGAGTCVRPALAEQGTGLEYESSGGVSDGRANARLRWPRELGGTLVDGSITWTAVALSTASLEDQIDTSTWTSPSAITVDDEDITQTAGLQQTAAFVDSQAGEAGQTYEIVNQCVTTNGRRLEGVLRLTLDA